MSFILALLGAIPGIGNIITFIVGKVFDSKVAITQARVGADRDVAVSIVKASEVADHERSIALGVVAGNKLLTILIISFAAPLVIYEWKVIVVDIVFQAGTTDPIKGQVADWANTIIGFIFGSTTALTLGTMWFNRKG